MASIDSSDYDCANQTIDVDISAGANDKYRIYGWADIGAGCGDWPPDEAPFAEGQGNGSYQLSDASWPSMDDVTYCLWLVVVSQKVTGSKSCGGM